MQEMATDPDLNPEGYADYIGNEVFALIKSKGDKTEADNFISADGRVELLVEEDGEDTDNGFKDLSTYTVIVDGEEVFSGSLPPTNWLFVDGIEKAVKDHFSKKD
jgi:hypothetical protein